MRPPTIPEAPAVSRRCLRMGQTGAGAIMTSRQMSQSQCLGPTKGDCSSHNKPPASAGFPLTQDRRLGGLSPEVPAGAQPDLLVL